MRISDWSSDVCSSDLRIIEIVRVRPVGAERPELIGVAVDVAAVRCAEIEFVGDRAGRELAANTDLRGLVVVVARDVRSGHIGFAGRGISDLQTMLDAAPGGITRTRHADRRGGK